jgi:glycosyltransferase involved in cell wall biosynthesis
MVGPPATRILTKPFDLDEAERPAMGAPRLGIITSHPIQYYAPVFSALARSELVEPRVFYTWSQSRSGPVYDPEFRTSFGWDIPLLEGYTHEFVPNVARRPGTHSFFGLQTPSLNERLTMWGADALLVYGWNFHAHLSALVHFKGQKPIFFRGDSTLLGPIPRWRAMARRHVLRWVYRHVDVAIAVGACNRDYYLWCGVPPERIAFAPHCIDNSRFSAPDADVHAALWRKQLGIAEDDVVFLFAGKLVEKKDPLLLVDAFLAMTKAARLVIVGNGALETQLRHRAAGDSRIVFLPFQNQSAMPVVYRLADVVVLPSRFDETWGLAINEAMASSRAVIASSNVGAARDLIQSGVTGWVFDSGSVADLTGTLDRAARAGTATLRHMGGAGRTVISYWSPQECARKIAQSVHDYLR